MIVWITPDHFLNVDCNVVPHLARFYPIDWILVSAPRSGRGSDGLINDTFRPREYRLRYRLRDPRIALQYVQLLSTIRENKFKLLYTSFHGLPYFFPALATMIDLNKVIYAAHNVDTPRGASSERSMRLYQNFAFKTLRRFHVFSRYQLRTIQAMLPHKRHYYAPFVPDDYGASSAAPPNDRIRFVSFGYIREYKRLDILIGAFKALYAEGFQNIELIIAGRCDNWAPYEAMVDSHPRIHATIGTVRNTDIPNLISSAHYVVLPYQDGAQSAVLPLAYRYGRPVITSDIDAFGEWVLEGKTGFRFRNLSHESLRDVMRARILAHSTSYEAVTECVRSHFQSNYALSDILGRYRAFLDSALLEIDG